MDPRTPAVPDRSSLTVSRPGVLWRTLAPRGALLLTLTACGGEEPGNPTPAPQAEPAANASANRSATPTTPAEPESPPLERREFTPGTPANLQVDNAFHNFENVYKGEKVSHSYVLANLGGEPVEITNIRSTCGCAVGSVDNRLLKPGDAVCVDVEFDSTNFSGFVEKTVHVLSTDPNHSTVHLNFQARVIPMYFPNPSTIEFGDVYPDETTTREIVIQFAEDPPPKAVGFRAEEPFLKATWESTEANGRPALKVVLSIDHPNHLGILATLVGLTFDHPRTPDLILPVNGNVLAGIVIEPRTRLDFGKIPRVEPVSQVIDIQVRDSSSEFQIESVKVDQTAVANKTADQISQITTEVETVKANAHYKIHVHVKPGTDDSYFLAKIKIKTNHPDLEQHTVRVQGFLVEEQSAGG